MTLRLRTFGGVYLTRDGALLTGAAGQRRLLALLTVIAAAGERGISRDKVLALLWSEGEPEKSRHALTQALYHTRKALRAEQILLNGADLRINSEILSSDLGDLQRAVSAGQLEDAVELYTGAFLDGFYLNGDPGFDFWVASERDRLSRQHTDLLSTLATRAAEAGELASERLWRERLVNHDSLDAGALARLMKCLVASGDRGGALQHARAYAARMRAELDLPPDRSIVEQVAELRRTMRKSDPGIAIESIAAEVAAAEAEAEANSASAPAQAITPMPVLELSPAPAPVTHAARPMRVRRRVALQIWTAATVASLAVVVAARAAASHLSNERAAAEASTIMVAPFMVPASDPSTTYLSEGLLDLLTTRIGDADSKRTTDPARVLRAWKSAGFGNDSALSLTAASRVARQLGAGQMLIGSVTSSGGSVLVHASVVDATSLAVKAQADVRGSPDSLIALADQIIGSLILKEFNEHVGGGLQPIAVSHLALRAYLTGRASYRRGEYYGAIRAYNRALAEAPTFALAALGLAMAADHVNVAEQHDRGLAVAWARQDDLSPADRAYLRAFAGPRYPEPSSAAEALAAWEHVVRVAPDRAEGWHQLGESFYYDGEAMGMKDGPARSGEAFRHALALDPTFAPSRRMLTLLLARQGDTASLRALLATQTSPDTGDASRIFVQWRVARALGDWREVERLRRAFGDASNSALRSIAMTSQVDGVSLDDGDQAIEILRHRTLTDAEEIDVMLARHSRALSSGNTGQALAITEELGARQPALHPQLRLRVLDALYSTGDRTAALAAATSLEHRVTATPTTVADSAVRLADVCVLGQWRLSLHDTTGARESVRALRVAGPSHFPVAVGANPIACAELIDASLAIAERGPAGRDRLAHLDSLMLSGPAVNDAMRYANLIVARQYQAIGEPAKGLAALQRRSYLRGWPRYRATGLALQMQLAVAVGDSVTARSAYKRLMATQTPPVIADHSNALVHRLRAFSRRLVQ